MSVINRNKGRERDPSYSSMRFVNVVIEAEKIAIEYSDIVVLEVFLMPRSALRSTVSILSDSEKIALVR